MDVNQYLLYGIPAITIIIVLVRVAREVGLPSKYAPAASILFGILVGMGMAYENSTSWAAGLVIGIMLGATACGIYDAGKIKAGD